jgi:hypothetical protein
MGGFPLFTGQNFHWGSKGGSAPLFTGQIRGQNFLWGSKGGSAPLKEKTAHMERRQPSKPSISTQQRNIACRFKGGSPYFMGV